MEEQVTQQGYEMATRVLMSPFRQKATTLAKHRSSKRRSRSLARACMGTGETYGLRVAEAGEQLLPHRFRCDLAETNDLRSNGGAKLGLGGETPGPGPGGKSGTPKQIGVSRMTMAPTASDSATASLRVVDRVMPVAG